MSATAEIPTAEVVGPYQRQLKQAHEARLNRLLGPSKRTLRPPPTPPKPSQRTGPMKTHDDVRKRIYAIFGPSIEIIDAKNELRLQPEFADLIGANPKSPDLCLLVRTAQRQFGCRAAIFFRQFCYLDLIGGDGQRRIERFHNSRKTVEVIASFDCGEQPINGVGIVLYPPSKQHRLGDKRKRSSRDSRKPSGKLKSLPVS